MKTKTTYIDDKQPTLKKLQEMVGGYIQIVEVKGKQIIMDEEKKQWQRKIKHKESGNVSGKVLKHVKL